MNVAVLSMFRDSADYLPKYLHQVNTLSELLHAKGDRLRVVAIENDSQDDTYRRLDRNLQHWPGSRLLKAHDDCPYYPSEDIPERWRHIAWVCNQLLDAVTENDDVVLYVESDLTWQPADMLELARLANLTGAVTAPSYFRVKGGRYYDTWGSRKNGIRFSPRFPYTDAWPQGDPKLMKVDSCASVLAVRADIARETRFTVDDGFVGWSRSVAKRAIGGLQMHTGLAVIHP
jgi:hypothetical protein